MIGVAFFTQAWSVQSSRIDFSPVSANSDLAFAKSSV